VAECNDVIVVSVVEPNGDGEFPYFPACFVWFGLVVVEVSGTAAVWGWIASNNTGVAMDAIGKALV
jgi:hypothetical protein